MSVTLKVVKNWVWKFKFPRCAVYCKSNIFDNYWIVTLLEKKKISGNVGQRAGCWDEGVLKEEITLKSSHFYRISFDKLFQPMSITLKVEKNIVWKCLLGCTLPKVPHQGCFTWPTSEVQINMMFQFKSSKVSHHLSNATAAPLTNHTSISGWQWRCRGRCSKGWRSSLQHFSWLSLIGEGGLGPRYL